MASRSVNKCILLGFLGRDAETSFLGSGTAVTKFSIATTYRFKDTASGEWRENTSWHAVVLWRSEKLGEFLTKGKQVYVEGRLQTSHYENKEGQKVYKTEVIAEEVILLGGNSNAQTDDEPLKSAPRGAVRTMPTPRAAVQDQLDEEDSVPF